MSTYTAMRMGGSPAIHAKTARAAATAAADLAPTVAPQPAAPATPVSTGCLAILHAHLKQRAVAAGHVMMQGPVYAASAGMEFPVTRVCPDTLGLRVPGIATH